MDGAPAIPLSRPLISKLYIPHCYDYDLDLLDQLSGHGLTFDEIIINYDIKLPLYTLGRIVDALGANIKCLRILFSLSGCMYIAQESTARLAKSKTMLLQIVRDMTDL